MGRTMTVIGWIQGEMHSCSVTYIPLFDCYHEWSSQMDAQDHSIDEHNN